MDRWIGLDCHEVSIAACILEEVEPKSRHLRFLNDNESCSRFTRARTDANTRVVPEAIGGA